MTESHEEAENRAEVSAVTALMQQIEPHKDCAWEKVGSCVYCVDHDVRLYQGDLPDDKRTTPKCAPGEHEWDDANSMSQCGFYYLCLRCGKQEWT